MNRHATPGQHLAWSRALQTCRRCLVGHPMLARHRDPWSAPSRVLATRGLGVATTRRKRFDKPSLPGTRPIANSRLAEIRPTLALSGRRSAPAWPCIAQPSWRQATTELADRCRTRLTMPSSASTVAAFRARRSCRWTTVTPSRVEARARDGRRQCRAEPDAPLNCVVAQRRTARFVGAGLIATMLARNSSIAGRCLIPEN